MKTRTLALTTLLVFAAGCTPRPARFADAPPVEVVADDAPIPVPRPFDPVPEWRLSEAYLRRPLVNALDPARVPVAGDVNALDEVPRSSWMSPTIAEIALDLDPPALPFHRLSAPATGREGAVRVVDARGRFFELWRDPPDRPEMSTAAAVIGGRLTRALGYRVPGVWALDLGLRDFSVHTPEDLGALRALFDSGPAPRDGLHRVGVVRWPIGADLGPTHGFDRRIGDRNDRVPHLDRRTMRALGVVFEWLGVTRFASGVLRDTYVGAPGQGHVVHYVVDLGGALGADAVVRADLPRDDDTDLAGRNTLVTMGTLGLYTPKIAPTQRRWPAIGEYSAELGNKRFQTSPPFEPIDRLLPADAYWIARRIAALPPAAIEAAVEAGRVGDRAARARLLALIQARRLAVVSRAFAAVTPCEVERAERGAVLLRDDAVLRGFASAESTRYRLELIDDRGAILAGPSIVAPRTTRFSVPLPVQAPYLVLRVTALRDGAPAPRSFEAHLVQHHDRLALVGVRH